MKRTLVIFAAFCSLWLASRLSMAQAPQLSSFASVQPKRLFLTESTTTETPSFSDYSVTKNKASSTGYNAGDILINPGISLGLLGYGYGYFGSNYSGFVPLTLNVEYSYNDQLAFGGYIGIYSRKYKYGSNGESIRLSNFTIGARATFHGTALLNDAFDSDMDADKLDIYATVILGVRTERWNYDDATGSFAGYYGNRTRLVFGPALGLRYWFTPQIGAFIEGGRGAFGVATLGVSFRI